MKVGEYRGYILAVPTSGGKAGKGRNITTSLQVLSGSFLVKQYRIRVGDEAALKGGIKKAIVWIDERQGIASIRNDISEPFAKETQ